jgi:hypothetical protein
MGFGMSVDVIIGSGAVFGYTGVIDRFGGLLRCYGPHAPRSLRLSRFLI